MVNYSGRSEIDLTLMKNIPLTQGKYALVDDEDYDWLMTWKWFVYKGHSTDYAMANDDGTTIQMHRVILMTHTNEVVDHINHNGLDNRRCNLRNCTIRENCANRINIGTSKYTGVYYSGSVHDRNLKKWRAEITVNRKHIHLGRYHTELEAYYAYQYYLMSIPTKLK
jgi:hypothetical protein